MWKCYIVYQVLWVGLKLSPIGQFFTLSPATFGEKSDRKESNVCVDEALVTIHSVKPNCCDLDVTINVCVNT